MQPDPSDARHLPRRALLALVGGAAALLPTVAAASTPRQAASRQASAAATDLAIKPDSPVDQSAALQHAIDQATARGAALVLPSGRIRASRVRLRLGTVLTGAGERTVIEAAGDGPVFLADAAHGLRLEHLAVAGRRDGAALPPPGDPASALVDIRRSDTISLDDLTLHDAPASALALEAASGRVSNSRILRVGAAAIRSLDARGLAIVGNEIWDCADNGILVWRSALGADGTIVSANRIARIGARSGGSGQNGNGINVFRADGVLVQGNRIDVCAYSAVRANQGSGIQVVANAASRIGEVAIYSEFAHEGAVIASNHIDGAATGIAVTNFDVGGRLAVVQGNVVRNLTRREHELVDKRGDGIWIEADASVTGNTIESAATAGLVVGWGRHMRNVVATSNMIRDCRAGILVTRDPAAGACLIAQNLIAGARDGAIRLMDHGRPVGPDLATTGLAGRITITANLVA